MRIALSTLTGLALCLPATAQDGNRELKELAERLRALEARLKAQEGKKDGDKPVEVTVTAVKKDGDKKPDGAQKEGTFRVIEMKKDGDKRPEAGKEGVIVVRVESDEKKPEAKKDGDKRPEGPRGGGNPFNPGGPPTGGGFSGGGFGGTFGGGPGGPMGPGGPGGPPMGGGFGFTARMEGTPPGFDKLSKDEQEQFRKLLAKMRGGDQPMRVEMRVVEQRREEGGRKPEGDRRPEGESRRPGPDGDRGGRPSLEERLDRLERSIDELRRGLPKR